MTAEERRRARFDELRSRYREAQAKYEFCSSELRVKYGSEYRDSWLTARERKLVERLNAAREKIGDGLFAFIASFSPRDWSCDVPAYWVRSELTYEDAVRPLSEPLSVVPPLSYGATHPRT